MPSEQVKVFVANTTSTLAPLIAPLFVVGADVVHTALAQCTSDSDHTGLAAFGFGSLQYAVSSRVPVIGGQRKVLPAPEICDMQVMNMNAGHARTNHSWALSRLLRDLEKQVDSNSGKIGGLSVTVVDTMADPMKKMSTVEKHKYLGWITDPTGIASLTQAAITLMASDLNIVGPLSCILLLHFILSLGTKNLPVWKKEKFAARRNGNDVYALMRGNGHRHVFIIRNKSADAWNLEDLAAASINDYDWYNWEGAAAVGLAIGWFVLFGMACSMKQHAGYLLAIMAVGHISNMFSAFYPRPSAYHGFHLDMANKQTFDNSKVMATLKALETEHKGYGQKLLNTFFPGGPWEEDKVWWSDRKNEKDDDSEKTVTKPEEKGDGFQIVG
jgi:hypothetical protein